LRESHGPSDRLDLAGLGLASAGLLGIVWGLVRGNSVGWGSPEIVGSLVGGAVVLALFVLWELRAAAPMLPMRFFRNRTFALTNVSSLFMFFGMFGSIFLLAQFFQTVQGYSPFQAGLRILPWTAMPIFVAPIAGALSDRIGGQRLMALGLALPASRHGLRGRAHARGVDRRGPRRPRLARRARDPAPVAGPEAGARPGRGLGGAARVPRAESQEPRGGEQREPGVAEPQRPVVPPRVQ